MTVATLLVSTTGIAMLALSAWSWRGRTRAARWWVRRLGAPPLVLGVLPAMGLMICGGEAYLLFGERAQPVTVVACLGSLAVLVVGVGTPRFWGPGWYRRMTPAERRAAVNDPLGALLKSWEDR